MPDGFIQRHFANLRHIRNVFRIDPRTGRGTGQIAPWLSGVVQLVHPAFPGSFQFNDPEVRAFANPAAGANFTITVPPNEAWGLRAIRFQITTDATAGNRSAMLLLDDTVNIFFQVTPASVLAPSISGRFSFGRGIGYASAVNTHRVQGLPDVILDTGWRIQSSVEGLAAADQISLITVLIDVFPR